MAAIKIKFKDVFTSQKSVDIAIDFVSNGTTFNHFILTSKSYEKEKLKKKWKKNIDVLTVMMYNYICESGLCFIIYRVVYEKEEIYVLFSVKISRRKRKA